MIIFPIEHKLDWKKPPIATITLIVINLLVFVLYQSGDDEKFEQALDYYYENNLFEEEQALYLQFIRDRKPEIYDHYRGELPEQLYFELLTITASDLNLDPWLREYWQQNPPSVDTEQQRATWIEQREEFERLRGEISSIELGFIPKDFSVVTMFTHIFMHGSWGHLLGNMLFLFLFGFCLENAIGRRAFIGLYLLSGLAAAGLFAAIKIANGAGYIPLVGASGAISGEMGMYLALFGTKKINFLYFFGFVFGHWRASAILVFPIWVGKELVEWLTTDSNVAYGAHIGGLLSGYLTVFLLKRNVLNVDEDYLDNIDEGAEQKQQLAKIQKLVSEMQIDRAKKYCQSILNEEPERLDIIEKYFEILRITPEDSEFHRIALSAFKLAQKPDIPLPRITRLFDDYLQISSTPRALSGPVCLMLCLRFINARDLERAGLLMDRLLDSNFKHAKMSQALSALAILLNKNGKQKRAAHYQQILNSEYSGQ